jgi:threonine dehydratase
MSKEAPDFSGIKAAAARLAGVAAATPLLENAELNDLAGGRVLLKCETLQHRASFKFRGAYNKIAQLSAEERRRGVLAWSSGNHAQGVAAAGKLLGAPTVIVMPKDAPAIKVERVAADGAEIVRYDRRLEDREAIGRRIAADRGLSIAPPYDDPDIIEGQGTLAMEAVAQARAVDAAFDAFIVPCGGGGMSAGCALALEALSPATQMWIAEPEHYDESWASIAAGKKIRADISRPTLCDAIATPTPGDLPFAVMRRLVRGGASVSDGDVKGAIAFAFRYLKLVVEPGGAAALAAVLSGKIETKGKTVGVVLSGGNIDGALFAEILASHG